MCVCAEKSLCIKYRERLQRREEGQPERATSIKKIVERESESIGMWIHWLISFVFWRKLVCVVRFFYFYGFSWLWWLCSSLLVSASIDHYCTHSLSRFFFFFFFKFTHTSTFYCVCCAIFLNLRFLLWSFYGIFVFASLNLAKFNIRNRMGYLFFV